MYEQHMHTTTKICASRGPANKDVFNKWISLWIYWGEWCCAPCFVVQNECALHLLDSMLHVLLESACNPFCRKGILIKIIGKLLQPILQKRRVEPTSHLVDLHKRKLIFKRRDDYKMGWLNPTLTKRRKIIDFAHDTVFIEEIGRGIQMVF